MIIVNYKSKRELKMAIGRPLKCDNMIGVEQGIGFFVTNNERTFKATIILANNKIVSVR